MCPMGREGNADPVFDLLCGDQELKKVEGEVLQLILTLSEVKLLFRCRKEVLKSPQGTELIAMKLKRD